MHGRGWMLGLGLAAFACGDDVPSGGGDSSSGDGTAGTTGAAASSSEPGTTATADTTAASTTAESSTSTGTTFDTGGPTGTSASSSDDGSDTGATGTTGTGSSSGDATDDTGGSSTGDDGSSGSETGDPLISACVDVDLGPVIGTFAGSTVPLADDSDPPCALGLGGQDAGHHFVAPVDGFYAFDTAGTAFDTVVYATSPTCGDASIGCNDDVSLGDTTSRLRTYLAGGQAAVVVVDGFDASQLGAYTLDVDAILEPCIDVDLGMVGATSIMGSTTGELDKLAAPCAGGAGPDVMVRWVAPDAGTWIVSTAGSSFDTVLYVYADACAGLPLSCNDDQSVVILTSQLAITPGPGVAITVVVDGFGPSDHGDYTLSFAPA